MTAIILGPNGPQWIDLYLPKDAAFDRSLTDPVAGYLTTCVRTAITGTVKSSGHDAIFVEYETTANATVCLCGTKVPPYDYLITDEHLVRRILPPLGLHFFIWHHTQVPPKVLSDLSVAREEYFSLQAADFAPEPPVLTRAREVANNQDAVRLLRLVIDQLPGTTRPDKLLEMMSIARRQIGLRRIGWLNTYPYRTAMEALLVQFRPGAPIDLSDQRLLAAVTECAAQQARVPDLLELLTAAIGFLEESIERLSPSS
jgi:hypothetical protein